MIRLFNEEDFPELLRLGKMMHEESNFRTLDFIDSKLIEIGKRCINTPNDYLGILNENNGEINGMFIGYITPFFFSDQKIATDFVLFINPEHRGGTLAIRFILEYEKWAKENNAKQIKLGIYTGVNEYRTSELYKHLGYKHSGVTFKKEIHYV